MRVEPLCASDGSITGVYGVAEIKADKLAMQRRNSMSAHAEAICGAGSWYYDARTGDYEWSDGLYALLGADVWMPFTPTIRVYDAPADAPAIALAVDHARLTGEPYSIDHRVVRVDGTIRHVQERAAFFFDEDGQLSHVIGTLFDITARKTSRATLEASARTLRLTLSNPLAWTAVASG
ncbi:MAG: hypothetical protein NVSMB31_11580 [Vulcanimicrobiaceae bacterium]